MLLRSHDPPKRIYPSPRNLLPEFDREASNDNNEGSDNSDGGDDDPPNSDGRDMPSNGPQQEDEESKEEDEGRPTRAKRNRRKSKAPTTNSKTKKKKEYKSIDLVDFHKLIDTGDTDNLTLEQKGHYEEWMSNPSSRPLYARDDYVLPPLPPIKVEVLGPLVKEEETHQDEAPPSTHFENGFLVTDDINDLWRLDKKELHLLTPEHKKERQRQKKVRRNQKHRNNIRPRYNERARIAIARKRGGRLYIKTPSPPSSPTQISIPAPIVMPVKTEPDKTPLAAPPVDYPTVDSLTEEQFGKSPRLVAALQEPAYNQEQLLRTDLTMSQLALYRLLKTGSIDLGPGAQVICKRAWKSNKGDMSKLAEDYKPHEQSSVPKLDKHKCIEQFLSVEQFYQELIQLGFDPPRAKWTLPLLSRFQVCCAIFMCGGTRDWMVIKAAQMLNRCGVFTMEYMGLDDPNRLAMVQNVLLYSGANWWSTGGAGICGFARRCIKEFGGNIPTDPTTLLSFYGIKRKLLMLLLQDGIYYYDLLSLGVPTCSEYFLGLVSDSHVARAANKWKWTKYKATELAEVAQDLESWFPSHLFRRLNETVGGICQIVDDSTKEQRKLVKLTAIKMGVAKEVLAIRPKLRSTLYDT